MPSSLFYGKQIEPPDDPYILSILDKLFASDLFIEVLFTRFRVSYSDIDINALN